VLTETEFYFVRHGQTDWNLAHRAQGQTDISLNDDGRREAHRAARAAATLGFGTICSSPLSRARETAEIIRNATDARIEVIDELKECSWGEREGDVKGEWFERWKRGLEQPPGSEPYDTFLDRALNAINKALSYPGPILIVAHGGIYWAVQLHATRNTDESLPNATIVKHTPPSEQFPWWTASNVNI